MEKKIRIIGISLGSSKRDKVVSFKTNNASIEMQRLGTDGDLKKAQELYREFDGKVDAFGMGGIDLYLWSDEKKFVIRDAKKLIKYVKKTPVLDGSGIKNYWEPCVIDDLQKKGIIDFKGKKVLVTSGVERFQMAKKLLSLKANVEFGDFVFGLNLPFTIRSFRLFKFVTLMMLPFVTQLPINVLYPTGEAQERSINKYQKYYERSDIIAGDFHMIKQFEPNSLTNKIFITNTVTKEDIERLGKKGLKMLVTVTPNFEGRSFGANVIEALIFALSGKKRLNREDYLRIIKENNLDYFVKKF